MLSFLKNKSEDYYYFALRKTKMVLKHDFKEEMHEITLQDSLEEAISLSKEYGKPLIIYLHNLENEFSRSLMKLFTNENVKDLFNNYFTIFAWEVHDDKANKHLKNIEELQPDLCSIQAKIDKKIGCLLFFMSYKDEIKLHEILQESLDVTSFILHYHELNELYVKEKIVRRERLQKQCVKSAIKNIQDVFGQNYLPFAANSLDKTIEITLLAQPVVTRKILVLWYYNKDNVWSRQLAKLLVSSKIRDLMDNFFHIVPWDVQNISYYNVLKDSVQDRFDLRVMSDMLDKKENAMFFFIMCKGNQPILTDSLQGHVTEVSLKEIIGKIQNEFIKLYNITDLAELEAMQLFQVINYCETLSWLDISNKPLHVTIQKICKNNKMLIMWFCNGPDNFTKKFVEAIEKNIQLIKENFVIVPWYISENNYQDELVLAIQRYFDIEDMEKHLKLQTSGIYVYMPIENSLTLVSTICEDSSTSYIFNALEDAVKIYSAKDGFKLNLMRSDEDNPSPVLFQNEFYNRLSNRDYDCFKLNEKTDNESHEQLLKNKIYFALYGPPIEVDDKNDEMMKTLKKQNAKVNALFTKIVKQSQKFAGDPNEIMIRCIYNCIIPFPKKGNTSNNANCNYTPMPLFVIRRCVDCCTQNPCRFFIDQDERVYSSWKEYLSDNKLPKSIFIIPKEGCYQSDMWGNVRLECHLSPKCRIGAKIVNGMDVGNTIMGLGASAVLAVGLVPTITLAPAAAVGGAVVCAGTGLYSLVRSAITVQDRISHDESMSLANSEARGAYFNLAAGSLGFIGSGATSAVTYCAKNGKNIGLIARATVNSITGASVLVSGAAVVNSSYEVISRWVDTKETPDSLTILHLTSSILFFGHAVYNIKTANTIITESQLESLKVIKGSLRSNRHRKTFDKFTKETIRTLKNVSKGRAEVISYIKKLHNPDEVLALLTRSNKVLNKSGIKYSVRDGQLIFNGVATNILQFTNLSKIQQSEYILNIPPMLESSPIQTRKVADMIISQIVSNAPQLAKTILRVFESDNKAKECCTIVLEGFSDFVKNKLISLMGNFLGLNAVMDVSFLNIYPKTQVFVEVLKMIITFFKKQMKEEENNKNSMKTEGLINYKNIERLEMFIIIYTMSPRTIMVEIIDFSNVWIGRKIVELIENSESVDAAPKGKKQAITKKQTACKKCKGFYYV